MVEHDLAGLVAQFAMQLAAILLAAKLGGEVTQRLLRQPAVLGELAAGILIGPYALGGVSLPFVGRSLFELPRAGSGLPVSTELYVLAQLAAVILLFLVGLETDFHQFMRYGGAAAAVAVGGVILPFGFGVSVTLLAGFATSFSDPTALFMGAVLTATSVGITARVLADIGKLDTPEGVTIIGAAVVDDVLGILVLAVVVSAAASGPMSVAEIGLVGARALGFWLGLTAVAVLLATRISRVVLRLQTEGAPVALALALALFAGFLADRVGLALIIGAYSVGLALSVTPLAETVTQSFRGLYHALVPVFFVVMGMLVDVSATAGALGFGLAITALAIVGKIVGAALPALAVGFNARGAARIGVGMLPRGEVALIVAGVGLSSGIITRDLFGVAILMTAVTTLLAPIALVPIFRQGGSGRGAPLAVATPPATYAGRRVLLLESDAAPLFMRHLERMLEERGFINLTDVSEPEGPIFSQYRKDDAFLSLALEPPREERQELVIEFEGAPWEQLVSDAVHNAARDLVDGIVSAIDQTPAESGPSAQRH